MPLPDAAKAKLFCKHLYRVAQDRPGLLHTETAVAHPVDAARWPRPWAPAHCWGQTPDGKRIHLFRGALDSPVLREVGGCASSAFRAVGEGSGRRRDLDRYDLIYDHLIDLRSSSARVGSCNSPATSNL